MGYKTKVDWCDATWNPVTGCLKGCEYCYARKIAERFKGGYDFIAHGCAEPLTWVVDDPGKMNDGRKAVYPFGFDPTFHRYKLNEPQKWKKPRNIFVCSMADLFGDWVPDSWIEEVMAACQKAPQHRYLFLTKNPSRYIDLFERGKLPRQDNMWYGSSAPTPETEFLFADFVNTFVSIEPILAPFTNLCDEGKAPASACNWIIVGAETGNRKGKVIPQREWVDNIVEAASITGVKVFMKESLRVLMGEDFKQEYPWEV